MCNMYESIGRILASSRFGRPFICEVRCAIGLIILKGFLLEINGWFEEAANL